MKNERCGHVLVSSASVKVMQRFAQGFPPRQAPTFLGVDKWLQTIARCVGHVRASTSLTEGGRERHGGDDSRRGDGGGSVGLDGVPCVGGVRAGRSAYPRARPAGGGRTRLRAQPSGSGSNHG